MNFFLYGTFFNTWWTFWTGSDMCVGLYDTVQKVSKVYIFETIFYSAFYDFNLVYLVRRVHRLTHWFWSPVDLLDKRYYVPTLANLDFYDKNLKWDLYINHDSLFYKKKYFKNKQDYLFNKENMFFFDSKFYNSSLNFVGHMIHPTNFVFDYYSLKNDLKISLKKPKHMSFKLFNDISFLVLKNFI